MDPAGITMWRMQPISRSLPAHGLRQVHQPWPARWNSDQVRGISRLPGRRLPEAELTQLMETKLMRRACCPGRLVAVTGILIALTIQPIVAQDEGEGLDKYQSVELFAQSLQLIRKSHVEEVTYEELIFAAIDGMLTSLDPHSGYLAPRDLNELTVDSRGEFGGLGIQVTMENGFVKVISPIDDTPAAEAGIEAGDFVVEIDGETVLGLSLYEAINKMRGPAGSEITLRIHRPTDEEPFDVTITRAEIEISAAEVRREGNAVVARIKSFSDKAVINVHDGINELVAELDDRDEIDGVVIDLRNNPGGLLSAAVDVSDLFLDGGDIVSVRSREDERVAYSAERKSGITQGDIAEGWPIAILINQGSASAAEIVAGALQDNRRAVVIGTQSFGKGSVQNIIPVMASDTEIGGGKPGVASEPVDNKYGALRLTTSRYYTPAGRSFQGTGITPDILVPQQPPRDAEENEADERPAWTEAYYKNSIENDGLPEDLNELERRRQAAEAVDKLRDTDSQLAYALDLLRGIKAWGVER